MSEREDLERRLKELERERESITARLKLLKASEPELVLVSSTPGRLLGTPASDCVPESPAQKIDLFLMLFRCHESVFPKRWESKAGKKG